MKLEVGKLLRVTHPLPSWNRTILGERTPYVLNFDELTDDFEDLCDYWKHCAYAVPANAIILPWRLKLIKNSGFDVAVIHFLYDEQSRIAIAKGYISPNDTEDHWSALAPV